MNSTDDFRLMEPLQSGDIITSFITKEDIENKTDNYIRFIDILKKQNTSQHNIESIVECMRTYNPTGSNVVIFFKNVMVDNERIEPIVSNIYVFDKDVTFVCSSQFGVATFVLNQYHYYGLGYGNYCFMLHRKPKRLEVL